MVPFLLDLINHLLVNRAYELILLYQVSSHILWLLPKLACHLVNDPFVVDILLLLMVMLILAVLLISSLWTTTPLDLLL